MATDVRSHPEGPASEPASHEAEYAHPRDAHEPEVQRSVEYQQTPAPPLLRQDDPPLPAVENVLNSEIGVNTLLGRLKQSISSARDLAMFMKKRSVLEEEHAQGLKKLCRTTHEVIRRPESRQGSYAHQFDEVNRVNERMSDNGMQFALLLHQMHEELIELNTSVERGRKQWKQAGLSAERRVQEAELAMEKAKNKYDSLAEDYDRARTGDRHGSKKFGLKGPKSAAQYEEDLLRKLQAADADYASKVQAAQGLRQELLGTSRPQALRALQDLILECDSAEALQLQKFASFNEKLLVNNGLCVSPLQSGSEGPQNRSLREVVCQIDNERDLQHYVSAFSSSVPARRPEIRYERHPTLMPQQQLPAQLTPTQSAQQVQLSYMSAPKPSIAPVLMQPQITQQESSTAYKSTGAHERIQSADAGGPPQIPSQFGQPAQTSKFSQLPPASPFNHVPQQPTSALLRNGAPHAADTSPSKPVFGVSLKELCYRDGSTVPMVVYQCIQAIDLYGLELDGLYRRSGTSSHISRIKAMFDHDSLSVDFRNPEHFFHDVNSVTGVLKQFFRDLPNPILYTDPPGLFIEAARIEDEDLRRDRLHKLTNTLDDPEYYTFRALILHLKRVQKHVDANRMTPESLAIIWAPTLLRFDTNFQISDTSLGVEAVGMILKNIAKIFDDD